MPLSSAADRCLQAVRQLPEAMSNDVCTSIQDKIVARLCGEAGLKVTQPNWKPGVYALRLHPQNQSQVWQHGVTVVSAEGSVCIYQGWVRKYTLGEWLNVTAPVGCHAPSFQSYSPGSLAVQNDSNTRFEHWSNALAAWIDAYRKKDWAAYTASAKDAFGIVCDDDELKIVKMCANFYQLQIEWVHHQLRTEFRASPSSGTVSLGDESKRVPSRSCVC